MGYHGGTETHYGRPATEGIAGVVNVLQRLHTLLFEPPFQRCINITQVNLLRLLTLTFLADTQALVHLPAQPFYLLQLCRRYLLPPRNLGTKLVGQLHEHNTTHKTVLRIVEEAPYSVGSSAEQHVIKDRYYV